MKKITLISSLLVSVFSAGYAQDSTGVQNTSSTQTYTTTSTTKTYSSEPGTRLFRPFKVAIGGGYAAPGQGNGAGGGLLLFVEPAYRASDNFSVGLRLETAIIVRGVTGVSNNNVKGDASSNLSYTLNGQYYFSKNNVRPFIGAGVGMFSLAAVKFNTASNNNTETDDVGAQTVFGFYPRIGVDAGHFNLTLDYNFIPKSTVPGGGQVNNNYLGIRFGFSIGGGRIKE